MTWWIFTQGNCIWGAGQVAEVQTGGPSAPHHVQSLNGHIEGDFTITGEILWLGPPPGAPVFRYSLLRLLIEFGDEGEILLREDREPGVPGPRCPEPQGYCPDPFVLEKATD